MSEVFLLKRLTTGLLLAVTLVCASPAIQAVAQEASIPALKTSAVVSIETQNKRFEEARQAYRKNRIETLEKLTDELAGHPLVNYPKLWQLILQLKKHKDDPATNVRFIKFIEEHQGEYIGERAASDFLLLSQDRINSVLFNRIYNLLQWNQKEPDILAWYYWYNFEHVPRKTIESFVRDSKVRGTPLRKLNERLTESSPDWTWSALLIQLQNQRWQEVRYLLENAPAKALPSSEKTLLAILNNPKKWYKQNAKKVGELPARTRLFLVLRMRSADFKTALTIAEALSPTLSTNWQNFMWGVMAHEASVSQTGPGAALFTKAGRSLYDHPLLVQPDLVAGWAVRAYLRTGDWAGIERTIKRMSQTARENEAWCYWLARAYAAKDRTADAKLLYETIAKNRSFYGKLACDELGTPYALEEGTATVTDDDIERWRRDPNIQRAVSFYQMGQYFMGHREWNWALRRQEPKGLFAAATFAQEEQLTHRMINTGQRAGADYFKSELLYPMPHRMQITTASAARSVSPAWIYGIIRQESRFMTSVSSEVGAQGLMQIMPKTARWLIKKLDLTELKDKPLTDLETNISLGAAYLHMLQDDFGGSHTLASAAYNAGPVRARIWRKSIEIPMEGAIFIESIPYLETREYVKNVLSNTFMYAHGLNENLGSFKSFVGTVTPANADTPEADLP